MNILLWVLQVLGALVYGASGVMKVFMFDKISADVQTFGALPRHVWITLGVIEHVCTVGLVVPGARRWPASLDRAGYRVHSRVAFLLLLLLTILGCADSGDRDFDTSVAAPAYATEHPLVAYDEGHHNRHTADGTYRPFVELIRHDGYKVERLHGPLTATMLAPVRVLVVVGAKGEDDTSAGPAFTDTECDGIEAYVANGGALLLITDHFPFGSAVEALGQRFGVEMSKGMTIDSVAFDRDSRDESQLVFSRENGLLVGHAITEGRSPKERVGRVVTFTGQSVRGPDQSVHFLKLGPTAVNRQAIPTVRHDGTTTRVEVAWDEGTPAVGWGQAVALVHGRGRVVVLGEAAMLSAQRDGDRRIGMNLPGNDNRQLALNIMHWLSGIL
jgi:hypothetical protein